jgi:methylenetetrahydrofolate--tRNA-(uracil-5-)-methyltransferase
VTPQHTVEAERGSGDGVAVIVVGAGLAGSECAWQLAERGVPVRLLEQKPLRRTPAAHLDSFAELVCSNSLRGAALTNAVGLLKEELRRAGSLVMACADATSVPAGGALAVDRAAFSALVTSRLRAHSRIAVEAVEVAQLPDVRPCVLATGPLTSDALAADLARIVGRDGLAYYDAIAPIVSADSIAWDEVFRASRYDKGGDDAYVNCPMNKEQYDAFVDALLAADKVAPRAFEEARYFEGCLPLEVMAERGRETLRFGPLKPVGLTDPRTGRWPYACVQLRTEDPAGTAFNLVGFQSRMTWPEQKRVFALIPGLARAEYQRLGSVHRNTFVDAPSVLDETLALRALPGVYLAGQLTGVEGYVESAASGFVLGVTLAQRMRRQVVTPPPTTTALGALLSHLHPSTPRGGPGFQPSNVVWSMFPPLPAREGKRLQKRDRYQAMAERALVELEPWLDATGARLVRAQVTGSASTFDARERGGVLA